MSGNRSRLLTAVCVTALALTSSAAFAFDRAGYQARVEATLKEAESGSIGDPKATLARLDELTAIGMTAAKEFGAKSPKWAKLMDQLIADAPSFNKQTGAEINDKWGEEGTAGDSVGIPFKDIAQFGEERAYMELVVSPNVSYELVKKWQKTKKSSDLKELVDENTELADHLKVIK